MIDKWLNTVDRFSQRNLFWCIVATSILLAAWMQYIQHGWINPDSVLYFEQARLFSLGHWHEVLAIYEWPLYGICIGIVHKLTSFSTHVSAQLLNMLFFGIATASFLNLIRLAGGNNRAWVMGALLLFSSQYIVGDVLEMLMRDEGFWAFYLLALVYFIRYTQHHRIRDAMLWQLTIIIATLFRIEAILFLLFLPLTFLLELPKPITWRLKKTLNSYSITLLAAITISIALFTQPQLSISELGRLDEVFTFNLYDEFTQLLFTQADTMSTQVLGRYLDEFAIPGLLLTFTYVICFKIITTAGLIGTGLAAFGLQHSSRKMQPMVKRVMIVAGIIALISMVLIIIKVFVLSGRYVVALAWLLLIFASLCLTTLSENTNKKARIVLIFLCIILSLSFIKNVLPKREGYNYSQDAVTWLKQENKNNLPVFYADSRIRYYANVPFQGKGDFWKKLELDINNEGSISYDYLIINIGKRDQNKIDTLNQKLFNYKEIKRFYSPRNKKYCAIYLKQN